jgi:hypothetical protein
MKAQLLGILGAIVVAGCGQMSTGTGSTATPHPSAVTPSPTPLTIGTATLSGSECVSDFPTRLPLGVVSITLVNRTEFTGRFILVRINDGHSYQELADYIKAGTPGRPPFITEYGFEDVPPNGSGAMAATIKEGTYGFHCGYARDGKVTEFMRGPLEAR